MTTSTKKDTAKKEDNLIDKVKALGMVAVSPRDREAMKMVYKFYNKRHSLKVWLGLFEKEGFNIKNKEQLTK